MTPSPDRRPSPPDIEIVDLAPWAANRDAAVVAAIDRAFSDTGFVVLQNHGVTEEILADARSSAAAFFGLPTATKAIYAPIGRAYSGWTGIGVHDNVESGGGRTLPDLKETFAMGAEEIGRLPSEVPSIGLTWALARRSLHRLAESLIDICEVALDVPSKSMRRVFQGSEVNLVANWYPSFAQVSPQAEAGAPRIGAHTDLGMLSLLDRRPTAAGLQVEIDGVWVDVPWEPGCLTVNVGDLMTHWTSGRWISSAHRIAGPSSAHLVSGMPAEASIPSELVFGAATPVGLWESSFEEKQQTMAQLAGVGVDQVYMADHVSFRDGHGTDGFCEIAALSQLHPSMRVMISVYLLALRHPLPVARQIATMASIAPDRFAIGVGVGGEDRHEIEVCGVDPKTRGKRTDESLDIIRKLMAGETVTHHSDLFSIDDAVIRPRIVPPPPILIGGRSNAALTRTAKYGDGWIGAWCSPRRFAEATALIAGEAETYGRVNHDWIHGYQPWIGVGDTKDEARALVAAAMEAFYSVPFEAFEKYTPYGTPADVAEVLEPYIAAGCSMFNLKVVGASDAASIEATGEIITKLRTAG